MRGGDSRCRVVLREDPPETERIGIDHAVLPVAGIHNGDGDQRACHALSVQAVCRDRLWIGGARGVDRVVGDLKAIYVDRRWRQQARYEISAQIGGEPDRGISADEVGEIKAQWLLYAVAARTLDPADLTPADTTVPAGLDGNEIACLQ